MVLVLQYGPISQTMYLQIVVSISTFLLNVVYFVN
jgi:hypothetical protein